MKKMIKKTYNYSDCTHLLLCSHCIGGNCRDYYMNCIVLYETPNNKVKIVVFGKRNWKGREHIQKVRYVDKHRIVPILST